jgi:SfnB family sulfur acquisition oxidoreductase
MFKTALSHDVMVLTNEEHDPNRPYIATPAHIIGSDSEALEIASQLASLFAVDAAGRDESRSLPISLIDSFSQSGLWGITIPKQYGGPEVSTCTTAAVFAIIAEADSSLAQLPQNHFTDIDTIRWTGDEQQKRFFFSEVLRGARFGNAFAETNSSKPGTFSTTLRSSSGRLILNGQKFYATGALMAHWVQVAATDEQGLNVLAFVPWNSVGLNVIDDWSGFGQKTTASGSVIIENVIVEPRNVIQAHKAFSTPTTNGALSQLLHAAIDLGIARAAISETIKFVTTQSRPWADANVDRACDDPLTIVQVGDIEYRLHAAEAMTHRAAEIIDSASANPTDSTVAKASIATAEAKIATTELAILATNKLFELSGTKSTLHKYSLDRHWRNARTHTLHDPVRWKYHAIGNYYLNHVNPERHGWI